MMLLTKQIGTYDKAKCPRIDDSNGKGRMIHTGRYTLLLVAAPAAGLLTCRLLEVTSCRIKTEISLGV